MYKKNYLKTVLFYFFILWGVTSLQTWGQTPTVSLTLDKTSISEAGGKATLTATLSAPHSQDVTVYLKTAGTAAYQGDYEADFVGKGTAKTVAGGNGRGSAANKLSSPTGIFVDSDGNLFIADPSNHRIQKWLPGATSGVTVAGGNGRGSAANQLSYPYDIFVDIGGNLFIADSDNHRIQKWAPGATSGITVAGGNGIGSAANQLSYPSGIFVDNEGNLFIADENNSRIQKWASGATSGITVAGGNGKGSAANQLSSPKGIFLDRHGNLLITDTYNYRIQKWAPGATSGVTVAGGNGAGSDKNQLRLPTDIFLDSQNNLFIADIGDSGIKKWLFGATYGLTAVISFPSNQRVEPYGIYIDAQGNLFFSDWLSHNITKVIYQPQIVIPAGQMSGTLTMTSLDDKTFEDNEVAIFEILGIENAVLSSSQPALQVTIQDNDTAPSVLLSFSDSTLREEGPSIDLQVQLSVKAGKITKVQLGFSGTAVLGTHYVVERQEVVFVSGDSVANVRLTPIDNILVEPLKTIIVTVIGGENISLPYPSKTIQLSSDDKPVALLNLDKPSISEAGGKATLTATLSASHSRDVTVYLKTAGTATYQVDYEADFVGKGTAKTAAGGNGQGSAANQLSYPNGIFVDNGGNLFIADYYNHRVQKWLPGATSGVTVAGGNGEGSAANQLSNPNGIFVDNEGNLFITDYNNHRIQKWAPGATSGVTVAGGNGYGSAVNQLAYPSGIFVDNGGNLFIADYNNHRIQKWAPGATSGVTVAGGNGYGSAVNQLAYPSGIFVDNGGNLFIADSYNQRIQKWAPGATSGVTVAGGNGYGSAANQLSYPSGIFIDNEGNLFIADSFNQRIQKWAPGATSGVTVAGGNGYGSAANQLSNPSGIFVDNEGNLFIADAGNNRIQKIIYQPQIVIPAGQTTGTLVLSGLEDFETEPNESIILSVAEIENSTLSANTPVSLTVTLLDNTISLIKEPNSPIPSLTNTALSWGDYDRDGDQDLAILGYNNFEGAVTRIYRNDNGTLVDTDLPLTMFLSGDIKWTDVNKDGFLDLMVSGMAAIDDENTAPKTLLYLNNAGQGFTLAPNLGVENLFSTKMALGDLDNDGDIDLAIMGYKASNQAVFQVYKKEGGEQLFTKVNDLNPSVQGTENDWDVKIADFDLDGDNDILFNGNQNSWWYSNGGYIRNNFTSTGSFAFSLNYSGLRYEVSKLLNEEGPLAILGLGAQNGVPAFRMHGGVNIAFEGGEPKLKDGAIAVGDYNNDGLNDILVTGRDAVNTPQAILYYQTRNVAPAGEVIFSKVPNIELAGLYNATAHWVDYDVDGDLDLIMTGLDANSVQQTYFYKNNTGVKKNTPPAAPTNLRVVDKGNGFVEFRWDKPSDDYSTYLGYNIRIGTTPGGSELTNTLSNLETGSRLITSIPPLFKESYTTQLSPGRYYWSVQAIDQGYLGSTFASEEIFDLRYEWKLGRQIDIVDRSIGAQNAPKFALLDIDNDNDLDLVYGSDSERRIFLFEDKEYKRSASMNIGWGGVENLVAGDLNNDGRVDLVVNGTDRQLVVYLNTENGFSESYPLSSGGLTDTKLKIVDVNNNGRKEIMFAGMTSKLSDGVPKLYSIEWNPEGNAFAFRDESTKITALKNAVYDFGDFDKDSKVDFILSGSGNLGLRTFLYKNNTLPGEAMALSATADVLPRISKGTVHFIDYDGDGDEDLVFTGTSSQGNIFQVFSNGLGTGGGFSVKATNLDAIEDSKLGFGDFNGDGYTDIFYSGMKTGTGKITRLAQFNSSTGNYENSTFDYGNLTDAEVAFGDIDADGDLDMILGGNDVNNANNKVFRVLFNVRNESAAVGTQANVGNLEMLAENTQQPVQMLSSLSSSTIRANKAPNSPTVNLVRSVTESTSKLLHFTWNPATDDNTPSEGLTYSLRVGTTPTNDVILSANADVSGVLKVPSVGNVSSNLGWKLKMLPDGEYYWSVQAIDASFVGSSFSPSQKFTIRNGDLLTVPAQPAAFTSSKEVVCRSTSFTYTIPAVDRATSYKWSFTEATPNATIAATSSTSATVTFGAGFTGATLNVVASNAYGDSPKRSISIQVGSAPAQPGVISASNSVVCQGSSRTYSIASVSGASSYVWSYTGTGATFSSTGTSVQVTYGASATGGEFRVQAVGACGTSTARTIAVSVIPQRPVLNGLLTIGRTQRRSEQATRSIILEPSVSKPITIEAGAVFSAQIVGCPN